MAITIGRCGTDITFADPREVQAAGDIVTLQGLQTVSTRAEAMAWRDQMAGLPGTIDEPVVPVTFSLASELNGMYEVVSTDVSLPPGAAGPSGGSGYLAFPWSATLRRVVASSAPLMETTWTFGGPIPNGLGATSVGWYHWLPSSRYHAQGDVTGSLWNVGTYTRALSTGLGSVVSSDPGSYATSTAYSYRVQWSAPIANMYQGAARIETAELGGSTYYRLCGRQIRQGVPWRVQNEIMRVSEHPSVAGALRCEWWDGSAWDAKDFQFSGTTYRGLINTFQQIQVLRNSPEQCVIRLWCATTNAFAGVVTLDLSMRRGDRYFMATINVTEPLNAETWQCRRVAGEASSTVVDGATTIGIRATANDANGNRFVLVSDYGTTRDLVNGRITDSSAQQQCRFGIGMEVGGSGATGADIALVLAVEMLSGHNEVQRVVAR